MHIDADAPQLPERMRRSLPFDEACGVPVPWCAAWVDGRPELGLIDRERTGRATVFSRCTLCGESLGPARSFLLTPIAALQGISAEPPAHPECMSFIASVCPQLTTPVHCGRSAPPGLWCMWTTGRYDVGDESHGGVLFFLYEADAVHWYQSGALAPRDAVVAALDIAERDLTAAGQGIDVGRLRHRIDPYVPA